MCFSAEASFGASAVISIVGVVAIKRAANTPQKFFALIPLFFAIQQFIEGLLWIVLENPAYGEWKHLLTMLFLVFAWLVWPVYMPFSMAMMEKNPTRKKILFGFLGLGVLVASGFIYVMVFHNVNAEVAQYHINYVYDFHPPFSWVYGLFYLVPTIGSLMVSSVKKMWTLGVINMGSYLASRIFFFSYVISVWCFFGALASIMIYFIIKENSRVTDEQTYAIGENSDQEAFDQNI
jgi:hypothetical protein